MPYKYELLLKNGTVVDPVNSRNGVMDVAVVNGKIAEIFQDMSPALSPECVDVKNCYVIPGLIDLHVHVSSWLGGRCGHKMMARAGVTTALDMSGPIENVLDIAADYGVGLNLACVQYVRPGHTVNSTDPDRRELEDLLQTCLRQGAYGFKILGGHYPLTPEATKRAIEVVHENGAYVGFHAGTVETKSDINGFNEALELIGDYPAHLAHINSYCRGGVRDYMAETEEAIEALKDHPNICSESYLSPFNGTSARCSGGVPESRVTVTCLTAGGFPATEQGLEKAILRGSAQVNLEAGGEMVLTEGKEAVEYWRSKETDTTVSFNVNPEMPRIRLATAKRESGDFVVDCISTDGGGIPRNVIVEMGMALVSLKALTMEEFVIKTSRNPAKILGLKDKGHLSPGADADITVVDQETQRPCMCIANGKVVMWKGYVCGKGCRIITTPAGESRVREKGIMPIVVDPGEIPLCQRI